jgi:hypothetical protein
MSPRRGSAPEIIFFTARYRLKALDTATTRCGGFRVGIAVSKNGAKMGANPMSNVERGMSNCPKARGAVGKGGDSISFEWKPSLLQVSIYTVNPGFCKGKLYICSAPFRKELWERDRLD